MSRILLLSHSTPNPPDKGEKIRAHNLLRCIARTHEVHLVCFAREPQEIEAARQLEQYCESVYVERLSTAKALAASVWPWLSGESLNLVFFRSKTFARAVSELCARVRCDAAIALTLPMVPYVPAGMPYIFDLQDVDSEKWLQYAATRSPSFLFRTEAARLRRLEIEFARRAHSTILVTQREEQLFRDFAGNLPTAYMENGMDLDSYAPERAPRLAELRGRRYLLFVGTMSYYPNAAAAIWFASHIFPELRRRDPGLEFLIVGRSPTRAVRNLNRQAGVTVVGPVRDTRPYLRDCLAAVAPLKLARGIQLKVLEALSMGKPVLVSPEVALTFGAALTPGIFVCNTAPDYWRALGDCAACNSDEVRSCAGERFNWNSNVTVILSALEAIRSEREGTCIHVA